MLTCTVSLCCAPSLSVSAIRLVRTEDETPVRLKDTNMSTFTKFLTLGH